MPAAEDPRIRFERFVDRSGECWVWTGTRSGKGYGRLCVDKKPRTASRLSYAWFVGPIPDGLHVLHRCDNPPCVNPAHLFLGTPKDNTQDAISKGRLVGNVKLKGKAISNAILSDKDAFALRAERRAGVRNRVLSAKYGITESNVSQICLQRPWMDAIDGGVPRRQHRRRNLGSGA